MDLWYQTSNETDPSASSRMDHIEDLPAKSIHPVSKTLTEHAPAHDLGPLK
jgi:hypothetical protein